jgi:transposase-like protein
MSRPIERAEIITGIRRQGRYPAEEKERLVERTMQPAIVVSEAMIHVALGSLVLRRVSH